MSRRLASIAVGLLIYFGALVFATILGYEAQWDSSLPTHALHFGLGFLSGVLGSMVVDFLTESPR